MDYYALLKDTVSSFDFFHKKEGPALGATLEICLQKGALDVFFLPVCKDNTLGYQVHIICPQELEDFFQDFIAGHFSSRFNLTRQTRYKLSREFIKVTYKNKEVAIKCGYIVKNGAKSYLQIVPEYEDCKKIAQELNRPLQEIYHQARRKAFAKLKAKL